jgi:hypothetical protein
MEDAVPEVGEWEKRLLWKLKKTSSSGHESKKKTKELKHL